MRSVFGNEPLQAVERDTGRNETLVRSEYATSRRFRPARKQFVRSAAHDRCMHKVFGNEPLQAVERDAGRISALVPGKDAAARREPMNKQ